MRILLDMDEVLADFVGGALHLHGWVRSRLEAVWPTGTWSIVAPMGLTPEEFWKPINEAGESFWVGLQPLPWARHLISWIETLQCEWFIVSSPGSDTSSYTGKVKWIRRFFGKEFNRFILTNYKHILATSGTILIDDREETIEKFVAEGGDGIVFPSRHNRLYYYANNPVDYLSNLFKGGKDALQVP